MKKINYKEIINKKIYLNKKVVFIMFIILFILLMCTVTFGKYMQTNVVKASSKIAKPIIVIENGEKLNITNNENNAEYKFKIKNYNDKNEITDVNLNYNIEIISNTDESIQYELYKDNEKIDIKNNISNMIKIENDFMKEHNYILKISYIKENSNNIYDILENVQIKIHSEQERL